MPDVWTKHPDIVRDLLKEAGFKCGVEGRFLKGRDPAWTCIYDGKTMKGDLYIHHADRLRGDIPLGGDSLTASLVPLTAEAVGVSAVALLVGLIAGLTARRRRRGARDIERHAAADVRTGGAGNLRCR
jgi:hypothetical protein